MPAAIFSEVTVYSTDPAILVEQILTAQIERIAKTGNPDYRNIDRLKKEAKIVGWAFKEIERTVFSTCRPTHPDVRIEFDRDFETGIWVLAVITSVSLGKFWDKICQLIYDIHDQFPYFELLLTSESFHQLRLFSNS